MTHLVMGLVVAVVALISAVAPAASQDFCAGLNRALQHAGDGFTRLRGRFDTSLGEYKANITFGRATECAIDTDGTVHNMRCRHDFDTETAASSAFRNYQVEVER